MQKSKLKLHLCYILTPVVPISREVFVVLWQLIPILVISSAELFKTCLLPVLTLPGKSSQGNKAALGIHSDKVLEGKH